MLFHRKRLIICRSFSLRLWKSDWELGLRRKGDTNGEHRTMVLVNKHNPTGSNSLERVSTIVKEDSLIYISE